MKKGIVLGAGGARGFAHLGFLQVLEELGIKMDIIVGCSAGAIFGALWAAGVDLYRLERLLTYPGFSKRLFDLSVSRDGFVKGDKILDGMQLLTKNLQFEDLKVELAVVATDIETGELVVFREGNIAKAVRASISIPGLFKPYFYQGHLLVDGAVKSRLPTHIAKEMGAERILAVDVKKGLRKNPSTAKDVLLQSLEILQEEVSLYHSNGADILIQPDVSHIDALNFDEISQGVEIGRKAAIAKSSEISCIFA